MCENCGYERDAYDPNPEDYYAEELGHPHSMDDDDYGWCSERECEYRIRPHDPEEGFEQDRYDDQYD